MFSESVWQVSLQLARISQQYAETLIKHSKYELAETTLLKNRQILEPIADKSVWDSRVDWQITRVSLVLALIRVYQKLSKPLKLYQLLKGFFQSLRMDILSQSSESFSQELEKTHISMAICCVTLQKLEEARVYTSEGVRFLRKTLRNDELLQRIREKCEEKRESFEAFVHKKNLALAKLLNLLGKVQGKLGEREDAWTYCHQAYALARIFAGELHPIAVNYKQDLEKLKENSEKNTFLSIKTVENLRSMPSSLEFNRNESESPCEKREKGTKKAEKPAGTREKCRSLYEKANKISRKRPVSARECKENPQKLSKKESFSQFLREQQPDLLRIKVFFPADAAKSEENSELQSTKLVNSLVFERKQLKNLVSKASSRQKIKKPPENTLFSADSLLSDETSRNFWLLSRRPGQNSVHFARNLEKPQKIAEKKHFSVHLKAKADDFEASPQSFRRNCEETASFAGKTRLLKKNSERNFAKSLNSPAKIAKKRYSFMVEPAKPAIFSANSAGLSNNLNNFCESPRKSEFSQRNEEKIKENSEEIKEVAKTAENFSSFVEKPANNSLNKRTRIDIGLFVKQNRDFLSKSEENSEFSQRKHAKIRVIQRFIRKILGKRRNNADFVRKMETSSRFLDKLLEETARKDAETSKFSRNYQL